MLKVKTRQKLIIDTRRVISHMQSAMLFEDLFTGERKKNQLFLISNERMVFFSENG